MTPIFQDETQLLAWGDGPQGPWIKLKLPDSEQLNPFRGMTQAKAGIVGQRLATVLVEIGDNEEPVEPDRIAPGPLCMLAVMWCQDKHFQRWTESVFGLLTDSGGYANAKQIICNLCRITSRKQIDGNPEATEIFNRQIRQPYMAFLENHP